MANFQDCGCKICRSGLGEEFNEIAPNFSTPDLVSWLEIKGVRTNAKAVMRHLSLYDVSPKADLADAPIAFSEVVPTEYEPVYNLEQLRDFSRFSFDPSEPTTLNAYLQEIIVGAYLCYFEIFMAETAAFTSGQRIEPPEKIFKILLGLHQMLKDLTGIHILNNERAALSIATRLGFLIGESSALAAMPSNATLNTNSQ